MSKENVKDFFDEVQNNEIFGKEYKTLLTSYKGLSQDEALEKVVDFAQDKGYTFSSKDVKSFSTEKESDELNEEELDTVAGGNTMVFLVPFLYNPHRGGGYVMRP